MLRGINRQMLEITETNNLYYEKAFLVIRPEYTNAQQALLEKEAKAILKRMKPPSCIKAKTKLFYWTIRMGISAIIGGGISALILILCM
jgi:hypothetical protein